MKIKEFPIQKFHPRLCCTTVYSLQLKLIDVHTHRVVAILTSHRRQKTCWVIAHVYDSVMFKTYFNNVKIAEAICSEKAAFITRLTHEDQWV